MDKVAELARAKTATPPLADTGDRRELPARQTVSVMTGPPPERPTAAKRDVTHQFFNDPKKPPAMASGTRGNGRAS